MLNYRHIIDGTVSHLPPGKVVCVGRNYAAHARELNHPITTEPLLFIKPKTALVPLSETIAVPRHWGACHFEVEMSILIGEPLVQGCSERQAQQAIVGIGLALDLTLRDLQQQLKQKSLPWEKAKAFDGSCPVSEFVAIEKVADLQNQRIQLWQNQQLKQQGNSSDMLYSVAALLAYASQFFTLLPGDLLLSGTPAGVGPLTAGDDLTLRLSELLYCQTRVG